MASHYDIDPQVLVPAVAAKLESVLGAVPVWTNFVKTGHGKERLPVQENWWYLRAASVLRTVALKGPIGVAKLRVRYGCRKRRGHKPEEFSLASGNILRKILQQLEVAGFVVNQKEGVHKGRRLTPKGEALLSGAVRVKA